MSEETKVVAAEEKAVEAAAPATMEAVMHDPDAPIITMKKLLEAGAHFGHQTRRWRFTKDCRLNHRCLQSNERNRR